MNNKYITKRLEEIISELFEYGKRYGEDLGYVKDDVLYELRTNACDDAIKEIDKTLAESIHQAVAEERKRVRGEIEATMVGQNVIFNLVSRGELGEARKFNHCNHVLHDLLSSLDKLLTDGEK